MNEDEGPQSNHSTCVILSLLSLYPPPLPQCWPANIRPLTSRRAARRCTRCIRTRSRPPWCRMTRARCSRCVFFCFAFAGEGCDGSLGTAFFSVKPRSNFPLGPRKETLGHVRTFVNLITATYLDFFKYPHFIFTCAQLNPQIAPLHFEDVAALLQPWLTSAAAGSSSAGAGGSSSSSDAASSSSSSSSTSAGTGTGAGAAAMVRGLGGSLSPRIRALIAAIERSTDFHFPTLAAQVLQAACNLKKCIDFLFRRCNLLISL